jgi:hypothetical protein
VRHDPAARRGVLRCFQDRDEFVDRLANSCRFDVEDSIGSSTAGNARLQEPKDIGRGELSVPALQRLCKALGETSVERRLERSVRRAADAIAVVVAADLKVGVELRGRKHMLLVKGGERFPDEGSSCLLHVADQAGTSHDTDNYSSIPAACLRAASDRAMPGRARVTRATVLHSDQPAPYRRIREHQRAGALW